jgi:hypothetical protein
MTEIWKFALKVTDTQVIEIPGSGKLLAVQFQQDELCLWAEVTPGDEYRSVTIRIFGTGHSFDVEQAERYIGTVQEMGGALVWHVYAKESAP